MGTIFAVALFVGTAVIALWVDVRRPSLAPNGLIRRGLCAVLAAEACGMVSIANTSFLALYASVFGVMLPLLILMWLTALWVLRAISESTVTNR